MDIGEFSRPKRRVFETAIELFAANTYETVTMADIATALQRKKPSIYNHFTSKQEILDTMYGFFCAHIFDERKPLEALTPIFETGTVLEMMYAMSFEFSKEHKPLMTRILTVIHQRKYFDEQARKIAKELMADEGIRYVEMAFNHAIAIGRLAPFDTHWLALVINDTRNGEYMRATLDTHHNRTTYLQNEELLVYRHAEALIIDLHPPAMDGKMARE